MKNVSLVLILIFCQIFLAKGMFANDYFDLNLKCDPISITEYEIPSIEKMVDSLPFHIMDYSIAKMIKVLHIEFDTTGMICKIVKKDFNTDYYNTQQNDSLWTKITYPDSVIRYSKTFNQVEKLVYNKKGYLIQHILIQPILDTTIYIRNSENRIIKKIRIGNGIDTDYKIINEYDFNEQNDICKDKVQKEFYYYNSQNSEIVEDENYFQYYYDQNNNWIIQLIYSNNSLESIKQRIIQYPR